VTDPALPPRIARAAAEHGLGPPVAASPTSAPFRRAAGFWLAAAALWLVAVAGAAAGVPLLAAGGLVLGVFPLAWGVGCVRTGALGTWLFSGGVVHRENWRISVLAWPEVREVRLFRLGPVAAVTLVPARGRRVTVTGEPFTARLGAAVEAAGIASGGGNRS
jgi:hypothetical protein